MNDYGPTFLVCPCGSEIDLDDDWLPGDVVTCDICGEQQVVWALEESK